ncbi:hypothetical protein ACMXYX_16785 [Neptuniibacter sp. QD72_48]|uniref:hypothetical protein n=1 Tax=Neptuniibacter sp. QD72_48 TaxID=3398214 RepID=UPI0039F44EAB
MLFAKPLFGCVAGMALALASHSVSATETAPTQLPLSFPSSIFTQLAALDEWHFGLKPPVFCLSGHYFRAERSADVTDQNRSVAKPNRKSRLYLAFLMLARNKK